MIRNAIILIAFVLITNGYAISAQATLRDSTNMLIQELESDKTDSLLFWNLVTLEASRIDYDPDITASPSQAGPTTTSRAYGIIHWAMYDAYNIIHQSWKSLIVFDPYPQVNHVPKDPTASVAIGEAAYQTLCHLYPKQIPMFNEVREAFIKSIEAPSKLQEIIKVGVDVGKLIAKSIIAARATDGSQTTASCKFLSQPGYFSLDPTVTQKTCLSPNWGSVKPFIIDSGSQFRTPNIVGDNPKARLEFLKSKRYVRNHIRVKHLGAQNSSYRTAEQTIVGYFWAYDGAAKIGVPPRLYNQVVRVVAINQKNTLQQNVDLFAMVNFAMADAGIAAWETKYFYNLWRPVTGVRAGTPNIRGDANWIPLGAPPNTGGPHFTPPFPSLVSGHATFGSAVFQVLRSFYGTDEIPFEFISDEYNGKTIDSITKEVRPSLIRSYKSFTQAEWENRWSRIYLGVHWPIDQSEGTKMGRKVGAFVFNELSAK